MKMKMETNLYVIITIRITAYEKPARKPSQEYLFQSKAEVLLGSRYIHPNCLTVLPKIGTCLYTMPLGSNSSTLVRCNAAI